MARSSRLFHRRKASLHSRQASRRPLRPFLETLERRDLLASYTTPEDTPLVVSDPTLAQAVIIANPTHGKVAFTDAGGFTYTPAENYHGQDAFVYGFANNNTGTTLTGTATAAITITSVNDAPSGTDKTVQVGANNFYALQLSDFGFTDPKDDPKNAFMAVEIVTLPTAGKLVDGDSPIQNGQFIPISDFFASSPAGSTAPSNKVRYIPDATTTVTSVSFTFAVQDNGGVANGGVDLDQSPNTFKIYVGAISQPPKLTANPDTYGVAQNAALSIAAPGVMGNDTKAGDGIISGSWAAKLQQGTSHGDLTLNADGSFSYKPTTDYFGTDSFTYFDTATYVPPSTNGAISDPVVIVSNTTTVTINVRSTAPIVYANNDNYYAIQNTPLGVTVPGVLKNDLVFSADATNTAAGTTTPLNIPLTATLVTDVSHGTLQLASDGSFSYIPAKNFFGADTFTYQAKIAPTTDGTKPPSNPTSHDVATVTIYVVPPQATNDSYSTLKDTPLSISAPGVLGNDKGADGHTLSALLVSTTTHGDLVLNADGSFTYKPASGYSGADTFKYRAIDTTTVSLSDSNGAANTASTDATATDSQTTNAGGLAIVTIYINPLPPTVVANNDTYYAAINGTLDVPLSAGVLQNDYITSGDPTTGAGTTNTSPLPNSPLIAVIVAQPSNGTLVLHSDGTFHYVPKTDFAGADTFTYQAVLNPSATSGGVSATSAVATVTINVKPIPPSPIAFDDSYSATQGTTLKIAAPGVTGNDTKADGATLLSVIGTKTSHGNLEFHSDGSFSYTPASGFSGDDTFTYQDLELLNSPAPPSDDPNHYISNFATVTITVKPIVTTPPTVVANNDTYQAAINGVLDVPVSAGVLHNDYVTTGDPTTGAGTTNNTSPLPNYPLMAVLAAKPTNGTLELHSDGSFHYVPNKDFSGSDTFTYQAVLNSSATPGSNTAPSATATVTINVQPAAQSPVAIDDSYSTAQGATLKIAPPGVTGNDTKENGATLLAVIGVRPTHGDIEFHSDGSFSYTPKGDFTGADTFTYQDLELLGNPAPPSGDPNQYISNFATVTITVNPVTPPPVTAKNEYYFTAQNVTRTVDPPGLLADAIGPAGHQLAAVLDNTTTNGTLNLTAAGGFTYTPNSSFVGTDTFTYHVIDTTSTDTPPPSSNVATVTIYVNGPVAGDDKYVTAKNTPLDVAAPGVLGNDIIEFNVPPGVPHAVFGFGMDLGAVLVTGPTHGTLALKDDGSFHYEPATDFVGDDTFTYQASTLGSDAELSNVATVTIHVKAPEQPGPVAVNDNYLTAENSKLMVSGPGVLRNDYIRFGIIDGTSDNAIPGAVNGSTNQPPTFPLNAILVGVPQHGTVTLNSDGSFIYEPDTDFVGTDTFTYEDSLSTSTAGDPSNADSATTLSNVATVTIKVVPAVAHLDSYSTKQDTTLDVAAPGVLANDSGGSQTNPLTAALLMKPMHGDLSFDADGSFEYVPTDGYSGPDFFTYRVTSGPPATAGTTSAGDNGQPRPTTSIDVGYVKIYVQPTATGIQAHEDKYITPIDQTLTIAAPGVLANDIGPVNVPVIATLGNAPQNGMVTLNADGSFTYVPKDGFTGLDTFTYTASPASATSDLKGSTATVTIYVAPTDPPPPAVVGGNQKSTDESGPQHVADFATVVSTGSDGNPVTFTVTTDNPKLFAAGPSIDPTGQLVYTPASNVSGDAVVTVVTHNAGADTTQTFNIHVDKPHEFTNTANPCDVNDDSTIAADDVITIINYINAHGSTQTSAVPTNLANHLFYDADKDNWIAAIDVLTVINYINAHPDQSTSAANTDIDPSLLNLVAQDAADAATGKKKT